MDSDTITLVIGTSGAAIILIAFLMNQMNRWKNDSLWFDALNVLGSVLLVVYAILLTSIPFILLNSVWALVSLKDVVKKIVTH